MKPFSWRFIRVCPELVSGVTEMSSSGYGTQKRLS